MEKCVIDDCNGINGIPLFGIWDVKEGLARKIELTFRAFSEDIGYPIEEKTSEIFDPFIYYSFILVEMREEEIGSTAYEILDFLYELFPLSKSARRCGKVESYTLFHELIEDIMTLISEHYIESPNNKYHDNFSSAIRKLDEWERANLDSEESIKFDEKRFQAKLKEWEESHKQKDAAGEQTAPESANASTTGSVLSEEELEEYGLCDEAIKEIGNMLNDTRIKYKNERLELAYPIMKKWMFGNAPFKVFAYYFPNSIKQTQYNDFMRKKYLETKKNK